MRVTKTYFGVPHRVVCHKLGDVACNKTPKKVAKKKEKAPKEARKLGRLKKKKI